MRPGILVAAGLTLCGLFRRFTIPGRLSATLATQLGEAIRRLVSHGGPSSLFGLGAVNGLLPCGLVCGMMAKAATTGTATSGALTMAVFGLATVPALCATGLAGAWIPASRRLWMQRAGGLVVLLMGLITLARSAIPFSLPDPTILPAGIELLCHPY